MNNLTTVRLADLQREEAELFRAIKEDRSHLDHRTNGRWSMLYKLSGRIRQMRDETDPGTILGTDT